MRRAAWLLPLVLALVLWRAAGALAVAPRLFLVFLLAVLPALLRAQHQLEATVVRTVPRSRVYLSSGLALWALCAAALACAHYGGFGPASIGLTGVRPRDFLLWFAAVSLAALAVQLAGPVLGMRESPLLMHLIPRTPRERWMFAGLSLTAGICEEIVFRGFLMSVLFTLTASIPVAVVVSSASFGVLHGYQRVTGAARATVLGLLLAMPVVQLGTLLPSIAAHAAIDLVGGLAIGPRWVRRNASA